MFDIITDSACDLTPETAAKLNIEIVPFYVSLDGEHYRKEGKEIAVRDFYQFMVDNPSAYPKTSLPSLEDFETAFRAHSALGASADFAAGAAGFAAAGAAGFTTGFGGYGSSFSGKRMIFFGHFWAHIPQPLHLS